MVAYGRSRMTLAVSALPCDHIGHCPGRALSESAEGCMSHWKIVQNRVAMDHGLLGSTGFSGALWVVRGRRLRAIVQCGTDHSAMHSNRHPDALVGQAPGQTMCWPDALCDLAPKQRKLAIVCCGPHSNGWKGWKICQSRPWLQGRLARLAPALTSARNCQ